MSSNLTDRPAFATEKDKDSLNMRAYADALKEFVADADAPLTIALQGEWGSGKTSLMTALEQRLVKHNGSPFLGVWVNTWQYALLSDPQTAILKILGGIVAQVAKKAGAGNEERGRLLRKVVSVSWSFVSQIVAKQTGVDGKKLQEEWQNAGEMADVPGVEELKKEIASQVEKALARDKGKRGFLFFIDDLDRIDPPVAVQILELLKNIFDLEKCIFILAIDYGVVVKGLKPKFGEKTAENEREFRSFFDKIIQLPFSMPVGAYTIDNFLVESLAKIGYLGKSEQDNKELCKNLTEYARETIGTNPRTLKRLINSLSLIRLLIEKTATQKDDADFKTWKDVMFALVCLQIQFPRVYEALRAEPDFPRWNEALAGQLRLPALKDGEAERLKGIGEFFDETWEQVLWRLCQGDSFLEARALGLSQALNRVKARIAKEESRDVGEVVGRLMRLSAVTDVKAGTAAGEEDGGNGDFYLPSWLHELRENILGLRWTGAGEWESRLEGGACLTSDQARLQKNFYCALWLGKERDSEGARDHDYLSPMTFTLGPDNGAGFVLKAWGECCGNNPAETFAGFDLAAEDVQADLAKVENAVRGAWWAFDVQGTCQHDGWHLWWSVSIPIASRRMFGSVDFSKKLRAAISKLADALQPLLAHRIRKEQSN